MSTVTARPPVSRWALASLACAGVIALAAAVAYVYAATAGAPHLREHGELLGAPATVLAASLWLASALGALTGIVGWLRSPHSRKAAGLGIALNAAHWVALFAFHA